MSNLPNSIYRTAQVREIDRLTIDNGVPGYTLMCRAAKAALSELQQRWPNCQQVLVLCGAGNNGGDGYVLARLALEAKLKAIAVPLMDPSRLDGDARLAWEMYTQSGGQVVEWDAKFLQFADVVVDAILGTGIQRPLTGRPRQVVELINASNRPILSLDVPTGLDSDTGQVLGVAIQADVTVTFVGLKLGLYTGAAWDHTGEIVFSDLNISTQIRAQVLAAGTRIDADIVHQVLPRRSRVAHKGHFGRVLMIGGGAGMPGAIRLASEAALHVGAGAVTVATRPEYVNPIVAGRPELMCQGVLTKSELEPLLERADLVAIGPGLGQDSWAQELFSTALNSQLPLVVDADALNLLASAPFKRGNWVLTPHPGEAARLLAADIATVQQDRLRCAGDLSDTYGGTTVLKGAGTVVAHGGEGPWVCDRGNPGMAAPGMGDVLTGTIAGIAAQYRDLFTAAKAGVFIHGSAGDAAAAELGERGLLASALYPHLTRLVNPE